MSSFSKAADTLMLSQPTVSAQVKQLEEKLGEKLISRGGKGLSLTPAGEIVYQHAEKIFSEGERLIQALRDHSTGSAVAIRIGCAETVPKVLVGALLRPLFADRNKILHLSYVQQSTKKLLGDLIASDLDLVLADAPVPRELPVKAHNHVIGECGVTFLGTKRLVQRYRRGFPSSLEGAPVLLPLHDSPLRADVERWLTKQGIHVSVRGTFQDTSVMKMVGELGAGIFPVPSVIAETLQKTLRVGEVGTTEEIHERLYLISVERRLRDPVLRELVSSGKAIYQELKKRSVLTR